jgi:DNA-binding HxlR family transcriptional regulator
MTPQPTQRTPTMIGWPASAGRTIRATPNAAATLAKARIRLRATNALPSNVTAMPARTDLLADKWSALALAALEDGPVRFGAIKARPEGISPKVLTAVLRRLEEHELITRTVYPAVPLHVEYELTDLGRDACVPLGALLILGGGQHRTLPGPPVTTSTVRGIRASWRQVLHLPSTWRCPRKASSPSPPQDLQSSSSQGTGDGRRAAGGDR